MIGSWRAHHPADKWLFLTVLLKWRANPARLGGGEMSQPTSIAEWLTSVGMPEYATRFAENDIDVSVLGHLTDRDLKELGVSLGHRRKLLATIAELPAASGARPMATAPAARDDAQRRHLSIMFCDLVGSTALSTRLDVEDLRAVVAAYHQCCAETIEREGGFIAKYMGDGVLAYFGYPQASEHDAERAVRAGLALVEAVPSLETPAEAPLEVRVGIATGLVVVGDLLGTGAAQEQAVVGETPNLAARLQALAEPGAVVIASGTRDLTGGLFEYRDLGTVALKGFDRDMRAWQVLGGDAAESRFEALRAASTPLVGRDDETSLLLSRWEQAKAGEGRVVLLSGEAGVGKSRMTQVLLERSAQEPHARLRYFCSPHHQDSALHPLIAQLNHAAGIRRTDTDGERLAKLEDVIAEATDRIAETAPLLADLLGIPIGDRYPPLDLTPGARKAKTLEAPLTLVEGLAARRPVLMIFEDAHWSDPTTRALLDILVDRLAALRVLLVVTFRPEFGPAWRDRAHVDLLGLGRLAPDQCVAIISHLTGGRVLPGEIAGQILDRTDGVPLFVEELTKTVLESGLVRKAGNAYIATALIGRTAIPETLLASLLARLDRMPETRDLAQLGAALGRQFSYELVAAVAELPPAVLERSLERLESAELIFRRGAPPDAEYTFKHALVQDAAYGTILRDRRQRLHGRIAAVLETDFPEVPKRQPGTLARHCAEAGQTEKAAELYIAASGRATAASNNVEAAAHLKRALALVATLPPRAPRTVELRNRIMVGGWWWST
ncbi:class 3 adenylate cyclase [Bradyrhizobium japonicum]|uniref:AAA family ATPase n=1 Tax=Bradyrhizobium TaxID=374 RepID=UPI0009B88181|nr:MULTISPECIES: adenylate/guanylate cyclase domain-containing protein [Bradyrhizobium]MBR0883000.1 AAA family ATPase [Bradyrhizobium liaoningense]MBR1002582.1 AAA family ATPase [Bradyrhizobium liaoningense]MBR1068918.1 AAA family ATPase [Bradyrhizobium liaoningense]MCP1745723.1 class 3 adenylate cyclase [Bradyrhizobium japonicum]MCP1775426.1 class 3 adenylate cyclase [Bradyrhizobium japonicum]